MAFDWKKLVFELLAEAPRVIKTVEVIHANKDTASKSDLAATALLSATQGAAEIDPNDSAAISDASTLAGGIIDAFKTQPAKLGVPATP